MEEELEAARKEAKGAARAFNAVRQERYDAFTAAFEHIAAVIDPIFKDLTRSRCVQQAHPTVQSSDAFHLAWAYPQASIHCDASIAAIPSFTEGG